MLKSCKYCGGIHDDSVVCVMKPCRTERKKTPAYYFHNSIEWQLKREDIRKRDYNICRYCLEQGRLNIENLGVHHIEDIENNYNKRLEDSNLITLCDTCHKLAEKGKIEKSLLKKLAISPPDLNRLKK